MPHSSAKPKVSVIIPAYNCAEYLPAAINSVLAQTYSDYEIVVVDDGSDDEIDNALRPFANDVIYLRQENSGGPARPRNRGIEHAQGEYIALLDADDVLLPNKLKGAVRFLDAYPTLGFVFTNFVKRNETGELHHEAFFSQCPRFQQLTKTKAGKQQYLINGCTAFDALLLENFIGTSSVVCRRSVFADVGGFDESVTAGGLEDRDMWLKISRSYDIGCLDAVDHVYLDRPSSVSKRVLLASLCNLQVIERYASSAHTKETRQEVRKAIAAKCCSIGFRYRLAGDARAARSAYWKAFSKGERWASCKGLLRTTFLGRRLAAVSERGSQPSS